MGFRNFGLKVKSTTLRNLVLLLPIGISFIFTNTNHITSFTQNRLFESNVNIGTLVSSLKTNAAIPVIQSTVESHQS